VVYVNEKYFTAIGLSDKSEALGRPIEGIIPNSLMWREDGGPTILDIIELGGQQFVVTPHADRGRARQYHRRHRLCAL
jgi:hypothetical protein